MRNKVLILAAMLMIISMCGCATLKEVAEEASQIKSEEVTPQANAAGVLLDTFVPQPYRIPASMGIGYILALLRRMYKKKQGAKS